ncbi:NTP transferase domain-containing protein [Halohasta litorea]|uniref:NTP transferase domain-containing protein n=1 Tax=Halohasta litorea TaxID=869891 RepID=A0ABD6D920_9EURY|nr:NTP transferase domain-containing protein [Halohasta litorea]
MDGLLMCGGEGTRLRPAVGETEKPLVEVDGKPMVDHVVEALQESRVESVIAAVSPATPETAARLADREGVRLVETPGEGYVADLATALDAVEQPVVTVTSDLPLLTGGLVDRAIEAADGESLAVCVPRSLVEQVGASVDTTVDHDGKRVVPTGLNIVGPGEDRRVVWSAERLAINVNRPVDLRRAKELFIDM